MARRNLASSSFSLMLLIAVFGDPARASPPATQDPLSVSAALQSTRFMGQQQTRFTIDGSSGHNTGGYPGELSISPDRTRYVVRLIHGDVEKDGVWMDVDVGGTTSLRAAQNVRSAARLFSKAYDSAALLLNENFNPIYWLSDKKIAFRWQDAGGLDQIVSLDIDTGALTYLTHSATDVSFFLPGPDGKIWFASQAPTSPSRGVSGPYGGTYVTSPDGYDVADGHPDGLGVLADTYDRTYFCLNLNSGSITKLGVRTRSGGLQPGLLWWSPDGNRVVMEATPATVPSSWSAYIGSTNDPYLSLFLKGALQDPDSFRGRELSELFVVDVNTGEAKPLWNAPTSWGLSAGSWSPSGRQVILGPTALPTTGGADTTPTVGIAVVDIATGHFDVVPLDGRLQSGVDGFRWLSPDFIEIYTRTIPLYVARLGGQWKRIEHHELSRAVDIGGVRFEIRSSVSEPPVLYAVDNESGRQVEVLDPNPGLRSKYTLAHVQNIKDVIGSKAILDGNLYYPVGFVPGRSYPLVVQIAGGATGIGPTEELKEFDIYGSLTSGLGPSQSIYAAQQLAAHGMFVLSVRRPNKAVGGDVSVDIRAFTGIIQALGETGMVDLSKVGIAGESRPGWLTSQLITFSDFRYAAAIVTDAIDTGYFTNAMLGGDQGDEESGSKPFGIGLKNWLERTVDLNADRIRTPLLLMDESQPGGLVLMPWELFSRLRFLNFPVEYYLVPNLKHGNHIAQNPGQLLAVKQMSVDWFDFWLNSREDSDTAKAEQYRRWHKLRDERDAALKLPKPPRLIWTATPLDELFTKH